MLRERRWRGAPVFVSAARRNSNIGEEKIFAALRSARNVAQNDAENVAHVRAL